MIDYVEVIFYLTDLLMKSATTRAPNFWVCCSAGMSEVHSLDRRYIVGGKITLQEAIAGSDQIMIDSVKDMVSDTWSNPTDARVAVVTFKTNVLMGERARSVNASIQPEYYTYGYEPSPTELGFCIGSVTKAFTGTMLAWRTVNDDIALGDPTDPGQDGGPGTTTYNLDALAQQWLPRRAKHHDGRISTVTLGQLATMSSCMIDNLADQKVQDHGLYNGENNPDVAPNHEQVNAWCDDSNWKRPRDCSPEKKANYSNWGSLTLGFAVTQPDGYDYDTTLSNLINGPLGLSSATNTDVNTATWQGYDKRGNPAPGKAHGIRSTRSDMTLFVGSYLYYMMKTMYADLQSDTKDGLWSRITQLALSPPYSGVNWALDWGIGTINIKNMKRNNVPLWSKNGMTPKQGFSSYVAFAQMATQLPGITILGQVGVIVLVNKNMQGSAPNPVAYGNAVIDYLVGNTPKPIWEPKSDPADDLESDDPVKGDV